MRISVVICSVGRPEAIAAVLPFVARQSKSPSHTLLVVTKPEDLPDQSVLDTFAGVTVAYSPKGLTKQRNTALDTIQDDCDAVFFIDDDYLPAANALEALDAGFSQFPEVSGITGDLLADGINSSGVSVSEARKLIEAYEATEPKSDPEIMQRQLVGLYGCNMAYRCSAIGDARFDPKLPLYGWQEDTDFAASVEGENIKLKSLVGVHCGTKSGRETSGILLGYSQVANPVYLMRKGTMPRDFGLRLMARNILANHAKMIRPEPWISRRARARGNWRAFWDVLRGRDNPERILELMPKR